METNKKKWTPLRRRMDLPLGPSLYASSGVEVLLAASEESVNQNPSSVSVCSFVLGTGGLGASNRGKANLSAL